MLNSSALMSMLMDSLTEQIAVVDDSATIVYVNKAWRDFSQANGGPADTPWIGQNYLRACGDGLPEPGPGSVALAIRHVLAALPSLLEDGMLEPPKRTLLTVSAKVDTASASKLTVPVMKGFENALMQLSDEIADRYFQQHGGAPTPILATLA